MDTLIQQALRMRTSERAAIRLGAELSTHLQFMELECQGNDQKGGKTVDTPQSYCIQDGAMWKVKGTLDDLYALQHSQYRWIQRQITLWRDLHEKWTSDKIIRSQMNEVETHLFAEAKLWTDLIEFIIQNWKEQEPKILHVHQYVQRGLTLLQDVKQIRPNESATHFNMGMNLFDEITETIKKSVQTFYLERVAEAPARQRLGWSLDLLTIASLTAFVSAMFFGTEHKDFSTSDNAWNTLLQHPPHLLRNTLPPLLDYFFFSWAFYLDPIVVPSFDNKKGTNRTTSRAFVPVSRFDTRQEEESQLGSIDPDSFPPPPIHSL